VIMLAVRGERALLGRGRAIGAISAPTTSRRIARARPTASSSRASTERPAKSAGRRRDNDLDVG